MCRLFGMTGGPERVHATFWLLEAPDSLSQQSHREPDGTGLGYFAHDGRPVVSKQPIAAFQDSDFAREAKEIDSRTFVAHVRYASTGALSPVNTHPFEQDQRLFAHNGVIEGLDRLESELGDDMSLVKGETDSERFFALITRETRRTGDVGEGIAAAARWVAENLPVFAINVVLISAGELWALRYPDTHDLLVLERDAGGDRGDRHLEHASGRGRIHVHSADLATRPAVVIASEKMDDDPGWTPLASGELLHVSADLHVTRTRVLEAPPAHPLTLQDLGAQAAASQSPQTH
ncbi:MAG TPA: class II glutamine amidotransferase [Solirubrobacteraceae bacterium]|jgi:glutamine amidotransferase|nr:class II glutamine amidotransferase [Solirubrobacteraceae bacterium]